MYHRPGVYPWCTLGVLRIFFWGPQKDLEPQSNHQLRMDVNGGDFQPFPM